MNFRDWIVNKLTQAKPNNRGVTFSRGGGMVVNVDSALSQSIFYGCVRVLTNSIASLTWQVVRDDGSGKKEQITGTPTNWLLNKQANPEMTSFSWRAMALAHAMCTGNHYSEIERDAMGRAIWLWPIAPERVQPDRDESGNLIYRVWQPEGGQAIVQARNMIHVHGLGWDGLVGFSVIEMARRSVGTALAQDEFGSNFYAHGTHLGLVMQHPKTMSEGAQKRFQDSLKQAYTGPGNSFKSIVIEEGMTLTNAGMSMIDAQFIESRRFSAADIARWFGVPLHMLAELDRSTNNNIEHQSIEFVRDAVLPWCRRLEQEIDIKLFGIAAQRNTYSRLNIDTLQRGDLASRYTAYNQGRLGGWLCVDDIRALENMNPLPDGKGQIFLQPMNFIEAGTDNPAQIAAAKPAPAPIAAPKPEPAKPDNVIRSEALSWARAQKEANG